MYNIGHPKDTLSTWSTAPAQPVIRHPVSPPVISHRTIVVPSRGRLTLLPRLEPDIPSGSCFVENTDLTFQAPNSGGLKNLCTRHGVGVGSPLTSSGAAKRSTGRSSHLAPSVSVRKATPWYHVEGCHLVMSLGETIRGIHNNVMVL